MQAADDRNLLQELRSKAYADYLAVLFAPAPKRTALAAIFSFLHEINQIEAQVKEPLLAEMRLHYWQAGLEAALSSAESAAAQPSAAPAAAESDAEAPGLAADRLAVSFARGQSPLMKILAAAGRQYGLPPALFGQICTAAAANIGRKTPPNQAEFEQYCANIYGSGAELACRILAGNIFAEDSFAEACHSACYHGGLARGIATLSYDLPKNLRRQKQPVPADILAGISLEPQQLMAVTDSGSGAQEVAQRLSAVLSAYFHEHYRAFKQAEKQLPAAMRSAFLPLAVLPLFIRRIEKMPNLLLAETAAGQAAVPSLLRRQSRILAAVLFDHF